MCGVFGINLSGSCFEPLKKGIFNLQHRGQEWGGFSVLTKGKIEREVEPGLVKSTFEEKGQKKPELLDSQMGIAHVSLLDPQPIKVEKSNFGPFSLASNGRIVNRDELLERLGNPPLFIGSDAEILAMSAAKGKDCIDGIKKIFRYAKGAFCLAMLTPDGVFAARDSLGFKPLTLGRSLEGCAVSSESPGLEKIGMQLTRDIKPGEIITIGKEEGFKILKKIESTKRALCPFEFSYFARESGYIERIPVKIARHNMWSKLAQNDDVGASLVSPIPFSGSPHAEGYELASGLPYINVFEYWRYSDRSWTPPDDATSTALAEEKLSINEAVVKDKVIVLIDDSIFGATQIMGWIFRLMDKGAREVHVRIAVPPVRYPCIFDYPNRILKKLIAADRAEEEIRKIIGAKSLKFNSLDAFLGAIISAQSEEEKAENPLKPEDFCTYCFTGDNPVE